MKAVIFGAGKIARGFIAHLLYVSGIDFVFFDVNEEHVQDLNSHGTYRVHVMDNPTNGCVIGGFEAFLLRDTKRLALEIAQADICFTAVGGKNLEALGKEIASAFEYGCQNIGWKSELSIITCENWQRPADALRESVLKHLAPAFRNVFDSHVGVTEAAVMRSGVDLPDEVKRSEPLTVYVQDYWTLPVDAERIKGPRVDFRGVQYMDEFDGFLERKFFTYNAANATVSYLGHLKQYDLLYDAAVDPDIEQILGGVYAETSSALCRKYDMTVEEQRSLASSSQRKLQNPLIVDRFERNARDPIRKLGYGDRLVGPARLATSYHIIPEHLATSIAAAIYYANPEDPSARQLRALRETQGISYVLQHVCGLSPQEDLFHLVIQKEADLQRRGWIR